MMLRYATLLILSLCLLTSCQQRVGLAPVVDHGHSNLLNGTYYVVKRNDTLYSIAFRYDQDYMRLARLNDLPAPYRLYIGQKIRIKPGSMSRRNAEAMQPIRLGLPIQARPASTPVVYKRENTPSVSRTNRLIWPTKTKRITAYFSPNFGRKGIDIAGHRGDKIYATNSGVIAYAGDGLAGYGNLIIIRHDNQILTAYAHNERNLVKEGQTVRKGQVIANMGMIDRRYFGVHFETRKEGEPVNPLNYLR